MMKIILTHDIDSISKPLIHVIKRAKRFTVTDLLAHILRLKNLYNNLEELVKLEDKYDFRSTIFVPTTLFPLHSIINELKRISKEGWEIGLHFVVERGQLKSLIKIEKEILEENIGKVKGVRTHMLIINDKLLDEYEKLNFKYDSSLRAEEADTYNPFHIRNNLIEIPIGLMDADLFGRLKLREEDAWNYITRKIEKAEKQGAKYFTILFHQESLRMKGGRLYKKLLKYIYENSYEAIKCTDALEG